MIDPERYRPADTEHASVAQPCPAARTRWSREFRTAAAAVLLCAGLAILPAVAALDLAVGVACRGLDRAACLTLMLRTAD